MAKPRVRIPAEPVSPDYDITASKAAGASTKQALKPVLIKRETDSKESTNKKAKKADGNAWKPEEPDNEDSDCELISHRATSLAASVAARQAQAAKATAARAGRAAEVAKTKTNKFDEAAKAARAAKATADNVAKAAEAARAKADKVAKAAEAAKAKADKDEARMTAEVAKTEAKAAEAEGKAWKLAKALARNNVERAEEKETQAMQRWMAANGDTADHEDAYNKAKTREVIAQTVYKKALADADAARAFCASYLG